MAEGVFQHLTKRSNPPHPLIGEIDSAGTGGYHIGDSPDSRTMSTLEDHGITTYRHGARQVHASDFTRFQYIFGMDRYNLEDLKRLRAREVKKRGGDEEGVATVALWGDFGSRKGEEVDDPYYGGREGFETAYEQVNRFSTGFLKYLESQQPDKGKADA